MVADWSQAVIGYTAGLGGFRVRGVADWSQAVIGYTNVRFAKIRGQARNLHTSLPAYRKLLALAGEVRSGDPRNIEAQAIPDE